MNLSLPALALPPHQRRRAVVALALLGLPGVRAMPACPGSPCRHSQFEVAIVGAGAAGLAAAARLQALGRSVVVVEASRRVGGRAWTDAQRFCVPVDLGCSWLHQADRNPLTALARALNFRLLEHAPAPWHYLSGGVAVRPAQRAALAQARQALQRRMAGTGAGDASMASLLVDPSDWAGQWALRQLCELDAGGDAEDTSVRGVVAQGSTTPDWLVQQGMGRIVTSQARGIRVALNARVASITQRPGGVRLVTTAGDITAQHCIVTVSTGVLRSQALRFTPGLEPCALAALEALPMGHFNKVVLEFDARLPGFAPGDWLGAGAHFQPHRALAFLVHPFDARVVIALAGGRYGRQLASLPARDAAQEALSQLQDCVGSLGRRPLRASAATDWSVNPCFQGSYAYLRTGGGDARRVLARAGSERIHFAGEATAVALAQTCGGAYLTGVRAAQRIDALLGRKNAACRPRFSR